MRIKILIILTLILLGCSESNNRDNKSIEGENMNKLDWINIEWFNYPDAPKAILQIPISIDKTNQMQYIQLDTGTPQSILFGYQLQQILGNDSITDSEYIDLNGSIGNASFSDFRFKILKNAGKDRADAGQQKIGLLGTDFLLNKILVIDFRKNRLLISSSVDVIESLNTDFSYIKMIPNPSNLAVFDILVNDKKLEKVLYDTGSSAFDLNLKSKVDWITFVGNVDESKLEKTTIVNPMGTYNKFGHPISGHIEIGEFKYPNPILYYRDTDLFNESPFSGTLGNKPFFNSCIIIDFINIKLGISN